MRLPNAALRALETFHGGLQDHNKQLFWDSLLRSAARYLHVLSDCRADSSAHDLALPDGGIKIINSNTTSALSAAPVPCCQLLGFDVSLLLTPALVVSSPQPPQSLQPRKPNKPHRAVSDPIRYPPRARQSRRYRAFGLRQCPPHRRAMRAAVEASTATR